MTPRVVPPRRAPAPAAEELAAVLEDLAGGGFSAAVLRDAVRVICAHRPLAHAALVPRCDWDAVMEVAMRHRVLPALRALVSAGGLSLDHDQRAQLVEAVNGATARQLLVERSAVRAVAALADADVEVWLLKGLATAQLDYPSAGWRTSGDVDLLVRPSAVERAIETLQRAGARSQSNTWVRRVEVYRGVTVVDRAGIELDLHTHVSRLLRCPLPEIGMAEPVVLPLGDAVALPAPLRLVHAALHLACSDGQARRLSGIADIVLLADKPGVLEEANRLAGGLRAGWLFRQSVSAAFHWLRLAPPVFETDDGGDRWQRAVWRTFCAPTRQVVRGHLLFAAAQRSNRDRASYVVGHLADQLRAMRSGRGASIPDP